RIDSLVVRDTSSLSGAEDVLSVGSLSVEVSLSNLLRDTLVWRKVSVEDAAVRVVVDSSGRMNLGELVMSTHSSTGFTPPVKHSLLHPFHDFTDMKITLSGVDLLYQDLLKRKRMKARIQQLDGWIPKRSKAELSLEACFDAGVAGLAFNLDKGSYLQDQFLQGCLLLNRRGERWLLEQTELQVGPDKYTIAGSVDPAYLSFSIANDSVIYDRASALLHDTLQARLAQFDVAGPFRVEALVTKLPDSGNEVDLSLHFWTKDQTVRIRDYTFNHVTTEGVFVNRLPEALGGNSKSLQEFLIEIDTTLAYYDGMRVTSPRAEVRGFPMDVFLNAPIALSGQADALARLFGNTDFQFPVGKFVLKTHVNASLNDVEQIVKTSNGGLNFDNLLVSYRPSAVSFPLERLKLHKQGDDVRFQLRSGELQGGLGFDMVGGLDNIVPLLLDRPADSMRTEVIFHSQRGDWSSFRALFGADGYFEGERTEAGGGSELQVTKMKQTLRGLGRQFRPHLQMVIDTLAYYDILCLKDFRTGIRFDQDTLVLQRSRFDWETSTFGLSARVGLTE
ncbi:MAG: hypothetical protein AAF597_12255, partial [Bacteroidota bacterium]